ncbi:MAG TPA: carboxypeptidase regulatory-like domain-containing protein [Verrucomicrobiae bacterium]|jgi:thiol-disulfide isomerase/thioredoxin
MREKLLMFAVCLFAMSAWAQPKDSQMRLTVVDSKTSLPLADVKIRAWSGTGLVTDAAGICSFPMPVSGKGRFYYRITLAKPGYVSKYVIWSEAQKDKIEDIPSQYTVKMDPGVTIGGIVKNIKGEPIPGARVIFSGPVVTNGQHERLTVAANYHAERTDDSGHWQNSEVPEDFKQFVFRIIHPEYVASTFACEATDETNEAVTVLAPSNFLSGAAAMVLTHGIEVSGVVLDPSGKPAANVTITRNHEWRNPAAALTTGEDGRFEIANLRTGILFLTFQAQGLAAQSRELTLSNGMPEMKIGMKPGNHFQGRIVDASGKPIPNANVRTDRLDLGPLEYDWNGYSDDDGRFIWDSAPEGAHPYYFAATGYRSKAESELVADGHDNVIVLRKVEDGDKTVIDGNVIDAESKKPVTNFTVSLKEFKDDAVEHSRKAVAAAAGEYSVAVDPTSAGCMIEIAAPGYAPQMCERKSCRDGDMKLDFTLQKGEGIAGTVYRPDGKPAAGVEVAVCTGENGARIGRGHFFDQFQTTMVVADDNGEFIIPRPEEATSICAICDGGFVESNIVDKKGPFKLTLAPCGSIAGMATSGGRLLQGEQITLIRNSGQSSVSLDRDAFSAKTGVDGSFVISNIPPGNLAMFRVVSNKFGAPHFIDVNSGETTGSPNVEIDFAKNEIPSDSAIKIGDVAPPFEVKTVNGEPLRLADFKGKYVLLDFWATWCGPCVAEIPYLKATYNAFAADGRFAMISLSLDDMPGAPASYTRRNNMKWVQGYLGPWEESKVTPLYGVNGIPSIFLIDPNGKIINVELRGEGIREAVEKALGNH